MQLKGMSRLHLSEPDKLNMYQSLHLPTAVTLALPHSHPLTRRTMAGTGPSSVMLHCTATSSHIIITRTSMPCGSTACADKTLNVDLMTSTPTLDEQSSSIKCKPLHVAGNIADNQSCLTPPQTMDRVLLEGHAVVHGKGIH
jgi:hypothetical protein